MRVLVAKFAVFKGPLGLWETETMGEPPISAYLTSFRSTFERAEFLSEGVCLPGFGMRQTVKQANRKVELHQFDNADAGPMHPWHKLAAQASGYVKRHGRHKGTLTSLGQDIYSGFMLRDGVDPYSVFLKTHALRRLEIESSYSSLCMGDVLPALRK